MTPPGIHAARVAVAVVSWNTRDLLARCLDSLQTDAQAGLADVWVVDNASSDGSADLVREGYPWVSLIASTDNLGFGPAVNRVAARTHAPFIAPANADIALAPGALATLVRAAERHPRAGILAPRLILPDGLTQHSVLPFPSLPFTIAYVTGAINASRRLSHRWCLGPGFNPDQERDVPWAVGAFLLVRREAWEAIGGFDEAQWMYAEDLDLGWRLRSTRWTTRYVPTAAVSHAESASTAQAWGSDRFARWHVGTYAWMLRRRGYLRTRTVALVNVAGFALRAALLSAPSRLHAGRWSTARTDALNAARAHRAGLRPLQHLRLFR